MNDLDRQVAEALGWTRNTRGAYGAFPDDPVWIDDNGNIIIDYFPSTNWQQCGELIERFNISLYWSYDHKCWYAYQYQSDFIEQDGATPQEAVCRAVIAAQQSKQEGD